MAQPRPLSAEIEMLSHVMSLMEAFWAFEGDGDGAISAAELGGLLSLVGYNVSPQDVAAMMSQGDKNMDGLLSIHEFLEMNTKDFDIGAELAGSMRNAFEVLDFYDDEIVTADELFEMSLQDCEGIVGSMDADEDGAISFDNFKLVLNPLL